MSNVHDRMGRFIVAIVRDTRWAAQLFTQAERILWHGFSTRAEPLGKLDILVIPRRSHGLKTRATMVRLANACNSDVSPITWEKPLSLSI
jgi:hypothetical protein